MYCGALDEFRGIPQLLDAFDQLRDGDYELWLTGAGRSEQLIRERSINDSRIHYFGYLNSRKDVLELEQKADILIHTRDLNSPAAPYCFPSKIFEYLATGKPVLSVDIPGIPREYFKYMIKIEDLTSNAIKNSIEKVVNTDKKDRDKLGNLGRSFVLNNKNSSTQATKIIEFIR
jgi:glycosyltransferase involved in cell wall biosynthesis